MVPATTYYPEELDDEPCGLIEQAAGLMPWALSIAIHLGVLLVFLFIAHVTIISEPADPDLAGMGGPCIGPGTINAGGGTEGNGGLPPKGERKAKVESPKSDVEQIIGVVGQGPGSLGKPGEAAKPVDGGEAIGLVGGLGTGGDGGTGGGIGGGIGDGIGSGVGPGVGGGVDFYTPDHGEKIVFVVDKSGSMLREFDFVKAELIRAISRLGPKQEFHVIFFDDGRPLELTVGGRTGLQRAAGANRAAAVEWIRPITAGSHGGGTDPRQALERAMKLQGGPPDLVFFLTDGLFPEDSVTLLAKLNKDKKVRVNTISFVRDEGDALLRKIAEQNRGTFRFVKEEELERGE
ncbi:MAG: VWA domain-containing protein [Phycisphaerae bacterium]|nr:VWA domain-containing protein [Phycisphaerae bacterium]